MTRDERRAALEAIATEIRACTACRLHEGRTRDVPGEGDPDTEVVFVGEGPGLNEDREGRPFIGRAGQLLGKLLEGIGWRRQDVFITNVVKCRPPDNRDPQPDEIAACAPYLRRQLGVLDPAVVVTLGRFSMQTFIPGARISSTHGTAHPVDPATGAKSALVFAMYHQAAALRSPSVERQSVDDMARVPGVLLRSRELREGGAAAPAGGAADANQPGQPLAAVIEPSVDVAEPAVGVPAIPLIAFVPPGPAQGDAEPKTAAPVAPTMDPDPDASQLTLF